MAVGEGGEDCAIAVGGGICEEACGLFELFPGCGWFELAEKPAAKCGLVLGVGEEVGAVEQTFRAIMPGKRTQAAVKNQRLDERARPSIWPVVDVDALVPGVEVLESAGIVSFGKPVGNEKSEIE